jgi:hypothetical protein
MSFWNRWFKLTSIDNNCDLEKAKKLIEALEKEAETANGQIDSLWLGMPLEKEKNSVLNSWNQFNTETEWNKKSKDDRIAFIHRISNLLKDIKAFNIGASNETMPADNKWILLIVILFVVPFILTVSYYYNQHSFDISNPTDTEQTTISEAAGSSIEFANQKKSPIIFIKDNLVKLFKKNNNVVTHHSKERYLFFRLLGTSISQLSESKPNFSSAKVALDSISICTSDPLVRDYYSKIAYLCGLCTFSLPTPDTSKPAKKDSSYISVQIETATLIKAELKKISDEAIAIERDDRYFWAIGPRRWLEIYFWALFGVFAGILRWISLSKEDGAYSRGRIGREWPWYITEIIVGPFVVMAFFFIAGKATASMIEGITETEIKTSIYLTMGIAFVLGFYVRRTFELLISFANYLKFKSPTAN